MFSLTVKNRIATLTLNKPRKGNCMGHLDFKELHKVVLPLLDADVGALVMTAEGPHFSTGLDLKQLPTELTATHKDPAVKALAIRRFLKQWQDTYTLFERMPFPVISCVQGHCIGLGIDLITATDIRLCTKSASFSVAEINVGLAADVGTLQRLPKVVGNQGWVREICFTGRTFTGEEAMREGLCQYQFDTKADMHRHVYEMAEELASKDGIAMHGTKKHLVEAMDKPTEQGLEDILTWNASMLQRDMWKFKL